MNLAGGARKQRKAPRRDGCPPRGIRFRPDSVGETAKTGISWGTTDARWVIVATVLGSGIAFLDGTVVNVTLPAIADDLGAGMAGLQ